MDVSVYEWAVSEARFTPRRAHHRSAEFIGRFSSASLEHSHYENGIRDGDAQADALAGGEVPRTVWVFVGAKAQFPSGVFSERTLAEAWVRGEALSGKLASYAVDAEGDGTDECWFEGGALLPPEQPR